MKKLSFISVFCAIFATQTMAAVYSGNCGANGSNLKWSFSTTTGALTITGSGDMADYALSDETNHAPWYSYAKEIVSISLTNSLTSIGMAAFQDCQNLTAIVVPNNVTTINSFAFYRCIKLSSVTLGSSLTQVGNCAFEFCESLVSIKIPNTVQTIGWNAFSYCRSLQTISIPSSVAKIGEGAFAHCTSLTEINVVAANSAYCSKDGVLFTKDMKTLVAYPIGKSASQYIIPDGVTSLEDYAFDFSNLISLSFPLSLVKIGDFAVSYLRNLLALVIPENCTEIGHFAFSGDNALTLVACAATTPPMGDKDLHPFNGVDMSIPLYVPKNSISKYMSADVWKDFTNVLPLEDLPDLYALPYNDKTLPEAVDLGLPSGMRWASVNVGATAETERGQFFQWGCTTPITREGWDIYCHGTKDALTKYCTDSQYGTVDNLTTLQAADDAAVQVWGEGWRMPTQEEAAELWSNCTRTETTENGMKGYRFTGKNGNSIFLPLTGWVNEEGVLQETTTSGRYWTSSLFLNNNNGAYALAINDTSDIGVLAGQENRYFGRVVRGVLPARGCRVTETFKKTIVEGEGFTYAGKTVYPVEGSHTYQIVLQSKAGCDSVMIWELTVLAPPYYTIEVQSANSKLGSVTGGGKYKKGTNATLKAVPTENARFSHWSDGSTQNPHIVAVTASTTYTAYFTAKAVSDDRHRHHGEYSDKDGVQEVVAIGEGVQKMPTTADRLQATESTAQKILRDGHIYILRDGKLYNLMGTLISPSR